MADRSTVHGLTWREVASRHGLKPDGAWGVGDGWAELVDRLLTDLELMGWRWSPITRLEEKYGQLRFEAGNPDNPPSFEGWPVEWELRVDRAEEESVVTCYECGRPAGQVITGGWVRTLCAACGGELRRGTRETGGP